MGWSFTFHDASLQCGAGGCGGSESFRQRLLCDSPSRVRSARCNTAYGLLNTEYTGAMLTLHNLVGEPRAISASTRHEKGRRGLRLCSNPGGLQYINPPYCPRPGCSQSSVPAVGGSRRGRRRRKRMVAVGVASTTRGCKLQAACCIAVSGSNECNRLPFSPNSSNRDGSISQGQVRGQRAWTCYAWY